MSQAWNIFDHLHWEYDPKQARPSIGNSAMASNSTTASWPLKDIVYVAIIGPVMLAAFLEWFLWLAAFCYCIAKAYRKAENWRSRLLAGLLMMFFIAFRSIFLPVMIVTLPLPPVIRDKFPTIMVVALQWFAFYAFAVLLVIPWLLCVYRIITTSVGRKRQIKRILDEKSAPKTVVVMPVYKEHPDALLHAINSVVDCEYPASCIHVFVSFDGDDIDELFLATIDRLGIPIGVKDFPQSIDVSYNGARVTVSRFPHGGKRHCQKLTFKLIDKVYQKYLQQNDDLFILLIDSDCILDKVCIQNFMWEMELRPGRKHPMLAMTGVITSTTYKNSLITLLQDMEYVHGQLFERSVESCCGSVTCLPGALTMLRFSAFKNMATYYFADKAEHCNDLFDYGKCHLGEDRWLTHLFMIGAKHRYQIGMCANAFCKTEAVQTFRSLLKQRRRWFLGFITNEVCMLIDIRLWQRYPVLCMVRFLNNVIRTTALLFLVMVISICTTSQKVKNLPVGFIAISLGLNYVIMVYFGLKLKRFKAWLYPIMFVVNPVFNWIYIVYGIFTAGQRTWGGPRADAGAADAKITPQQAIEHAVATGDDLNVIPETFRPAFEARRHGRTTTASLQPPSKAEGRFAPAEELPEGGFRQAHTSGMSVADDTLPFHRSKSYADSYQTSDFEAISIPTPVRVEHLVARQGRRRHGRKISGKSSGYHSGSEESNYSKDSDGEPAARSSAEHHNAERQGRLRTTRVDRTSTSHGADPQELSRHLSNLVSPQSTYGGSGPMRANGSPLGRGSPLQEPMAEMAESNEDAGSGRSERSRRSDASWQAGVRRPLPTKRKQSQKPTGHGGELLS